MSTRTGKWIYSISGDCMPADAEEECGSRDAAIAAAQAAYWSAKDRDEIRARDPQHKLMFHVGFVVPAVLNPIPGQEILTALAEAQSSDSDAPAGWLDLEPAAMADLQARMHAVLSAWASSRGLTPNWDAVTWEKVEVPV